MKAHEMVSEVLDGRDAKSVIDSIIEAEDLKAMLTALGKSIKMYDSVLKSKLSSIDKTEEPDTLLNLLGDFTVDTSKLEDDLEKKDLPSYGKSPEAVAYIKKRLMGNWKRYTKVSKGMG